MLEANLNALLDSYESILYDVGYGRAATPIAAHHAVLHN